MVVFSKMEFGRDQAYRLQAIHMAKCAGLKNLTSEQIDWYAKIRQLMPGQAEFEDGFEPWKLGDQEVLDKILTNEQRESYRKFFENIFGKQETEEMILPELPLVRVGE
jgi:hypothetical protein